MRLASASSIGSTSTPVAANTRSMNVSRLDASRTALVATTRKRPPAGRARRLRVPAS